MRTKLKEVHGIDWFDGAVMNCKWTGPLLSDVLNKAGLDLTEAQKKDAHVAFACYQTPCQDDTYYGASIPLSRAMSSKCSILLALKMNDEPLPANHGAPVRVVTPGIAGARSVKWLDRITVQLCESQSYYQQHDYKILPEEADCKEKAEHYWAKCEAIQDMPVNSVVAVPASDSTVHRDSNGTIEVRGYALPSGGDGPIVRVEVSTDNAKTWVDAELLEHAIEEGVELKWAWCLWKVKINIEQGKDMRIYSRATDQSGHTQDKCPRWNFRGVAYNGYGEAFGLEIV